MVGRTFVSVTPRVKVIEGKIVILDYIKIVNLW